MRPFSQGNVRGSIIHGTYYQIAFSYPDNWSIKWREGEIENARHFSSRHAAQLFLQELRN